MRLPFHPLRHLLATATLAAALALTAAAQSLELSLAWDSPTDPDIGSHRLYTNGTLAASVPMPGTNVVVRVAPGSTNSFTLSAVRPSGLEGLKSRPLVYVAEVRPATPSTPRVVAVRVSATNVVQIDIVTP